MNTHITTEVPPAEDFVRETHPAEDTLTYQPLHGTDPVRPKPRTAAEVKDLQAELEAAGAHNAQMGGHPGKPKPKVASKPKPVH